MAKKRRKTNREGNSENNDSQDEQFLNNVNESQTMSSEESFDEPEEVEEIPENTYQEQESEVSEEAEAPLKDSLPPIKTDMLIGEFIKSNRERLGISLKNISQTTKISTTNLEFLEANNLDALPNKAYVTGYVKSCNRVLGLNENEALEILDHTYSVITPMKRLSIETLETTQKDDSIEVDKIIKVAVVIILVIAILAGGVFLIRFLLSSRKNSQKERIATQKQIQTQTLSSDTPLKVPSATPTIAEDIDTTNEEILSEIESSEVKVEEKPVVKKEEKPEEKKENDSDSEVDKVEKRKFYPFNRDLYSLKSLESEELNKQIPENFRRAVISGKQNIYIVASKSSSWITYKSDNEKVKKFVLEKGRSVLIRGDVVRVFLGNLGGVAVYLNNKKVQTSSSSGVKSLVFPEEKKSEFFMPLFIYKKNGSAIASDKWIEDNPEKVQR